jgi:2-hydroxycyclohexanecarboxyl-CoA dehydrogenase
VFDLAGRTALVTGAGQGIGAGVALALAERGAAVVVNDLDTDRAASVAGDINRSGGRAVAVEADVSDPVAVADMVRQSVAELGTIDILVNNAGLPATGFRLFQFRDSGPDDWEPYIRLNLYGVLYCCRAVVDGMCDRRWGRIVTVSSEAARVGTAMGLTAYGAAKSAAVGFSRNLALELGVFGVTVNCVSLGSIHRPGMDDTPLLPPYAVGRLGQPADVAAAVVYLASDEAAWVTGQTLPVNGGLQTS